MGQIAGVFCFDSRPLPVEDERWLRGGFDAPAGLAPGYRPPFWPTFWQRPSLMMAEVRSTADIEGSGRSGSLDGAVCIWEGWLHNPPPPDGRCHSNRNIALNLYQERGAPGLADLIGDWSLAIWDPAARSILLASDYAGVRPLYYWRGPQSLLWSSSLAHLAQRAGTPGLDEEYAAAFLRHGRATHRTPYRGINPVPPGRALRFSAEGISTEAFWHLPLGREVRLQDEREYEDRFYALFEEAVRVRLPEDSPVFAELSGGLDSSSVVCMASRILKQEAAKAGLFTFSYLQTGSTDAKYIQTVESTLDHPGIHLNLEDYPLFTADSAGGGYPGLAGPRLREVARRMEAAGSQVLLTGQFGDFITGNNPDDSDQVVRYLERGRLLSAVKEAFAWSRTLKLPVYSILWRSLKTAMTNESPEMVVNTLRARSPYGNTDSLTPDFRRRVSLDEIECIDEQRWRPARPSQRRFFRSLTRILDTRALQVPEPVQHLSITHPFAHRPLVEFMLTIPPDVVSRPGETRRLMRRAFAGLLPSAIARRKSKMSYSDMFRRALMPLVAELLKQPRDIRLVQMGFLDCESIVDRLTRMAQGLECNETQLRHVILLESWLRSRGSAAPNTISGG
jgi:asparagine synthase (glutamine-hydrolysing)